MTIELPCIHPDGTVQRVLHTEGELQPIYEALSAHTFDIARGVDGLCAFVDDEGMLNGSYFNEPASMVLVRPVWGSAVMHRVARSGHTKPLSEEERRYCLTVAEIWRRLVVDAANLGQDILTTADSGTIPPPTIINLDTGEQLS